MKKSYNKVNDIKKRCGDSNKAIDGITLIALIITIIVLLILTGVTIVTLTGENGLLNRAKTAKETNKNATINENTSLDSYSNEYDKYSLSGTRTDGSNTYDENIYDFWGTWLKLAGIENPNEYNGKKILDNVDLMNKVMNSTAAFNYMMKSNEFIFPAILNSEVARSALYNSSSFTSIPTLTENNTNIIQEGFLDNDTNQWGSSNYYSAFDNNDSTLTWTEKTGANSIGTWLGYDFTTPIYLVRVTGKIRMLSYKIQYSDDKENWTDTITNSSSGSDYGDVLDDNITESFSAHRYWRLYVNGGQQSSNWSATIWALQFYGIKAE